MDILSHKRKAKAEYDAGAAYYDEREYRIDLSPSAIRERYAPFFSAIVDGGIDTVLEAGAGTGIFTIPLCQDVAGQGGNVVALDLSSGMLEQLAAKLQHFGVQNCSVREADFEQLPFERASFDTVCFTYSLHETADAPRALHEALRVLRDGGQLVVLEIGGGEYAVGGVTLDELKQAAQPSHVSYREPATWKTTIQDAGFVDVQEHILHTYRRHEPELQSVAVPVFYIQAKKARGSAELS